MKIEDFRPIRSQDSAPIKFDWPLTQESDWIIWTNQKITLIIFWLVKNGKDWNPSIPLVKRIFLVPDHIWPKTIKGQPALTHVIRNYVLLLVVPPLCLWWVTHAVTKALRLKILPGQQLPLFPNPPTLLTAKTVTLTTVWWEYLQPLPQRCMCPNREYGMVAVFQMRKLNILVARRQVFTESIDPGALVSRGNPAGANSRPRIAKDLILAHFP